MIDTLFILASIPIFCFAAYLTGHTRGLKKGYTQGARIGWNRGVLAAYTSSKTVSYSIGVAEKQQKQTHGKN